MIKRNVQIGGIYRATVSGQNTEVKILNPNIFGGWDALNLKTGHQVRIKTAGRLHPVLSRGLRSESNV